MQRDRVSKNTLGLPPPQAKELSSPGKVFPQSAMYSRVVMLLKSGMVPDKKLVDKSRYLARGGEQCHNESMTVTCTPTSRTTKDNAGHKHSHSRQAAEGLSFAVAPMEKNAIWFAQKTHETLVSHGITWTGRGPAAMLRMQHAI